MEVNLDKIPPVSKYEKTTETFTASYPEAVSVADTLFSPYKKDAVGTERTSPEAKVRIRRCSSQVRGGFRVVLSKSNAVAKPVGEKPGPEEKKAKKNKRHRNDKKGQRRSESSQTTTG